MVAADFLKGHAMDNRFQTRAELLALAAFFIKVQLSECLLDPEGELDFPQDMRGWIDLDDLTARWGTDPCEIMDGLRAHARRGAIRLAVDPDNPATVYAEALRDPRGLHGWQPWDVRAGVRLIIELRTRFRPVAI